MTARLQRLRETATRFVTPELASGEIARWPDEELALHAEPFTRPLPLDGLDAALNDLMASSSPFDSTLDARAAPQLHRALHLTRREASDEGIWRWLAVAHRPDFVRHRWENKAWATMRTRFWRPGTRPDSNAFSRLWWIAEMTRNGDDYELTARALRVQSLANVLFVRRLADCPVAVRACVDVLETESADVVERVLPALSLRLGSVPVETLSGDEITRLVRALV